MVNRYDFDRRLADSKIPVRWMRFYVKFILPVSAGISALTFLSSLGTFSELSITDMLELIFVAVSIVLPVLTFIEMKKLSLSGYYLNIALLLFGLLRNTILSFVASGMFSASGILYYLIWSGANLLYFKKRISLFTGETTYIESADDVRVEQVAVKKEAEAALSSRELAFKKEVDMLRNEGLLSDQEYSYVTRAHEILNSRRAEHLAMSGAAQTAYETRADAGELAGVAPAKERKVLSQQEIRDRNITWVLVIGVLFVLTAGVIFATSNWSIFSSAEKTALVALVAVLFFGISIVTEKKLKIPKTALAFWSLGALFVPVTVFSAGYFMLFGEWLSLFGEGRYVLGVIGATASAAIFAVSTYKYKSRLFAWLALSACSINAAFIIASFKPDLDVFYLGIVLYNWLILFLYAAGTSGGKLKIFRGEMQVFIPVNLVISTLFMLAFYEDARMHGFNLILISLIYALMVFSKWRKEYSYPFIVLLVYGIYMVVENTPMAAASFIIYALVGFIFAGIEYLAKDREQLRPIFSYASGAVSLLAFICINLKWAALGDQAASLTILASFLVISVNYFYLSYRTKNRLFTYAVPVVLLAAGYQGYLLINLAFGSYLLSAHIFLVSAAMFAGLYYYNNWKYTQAVSQSCGAASLVFMLGAYLLALDEGSYKTAVLILLVFAALLYILTVRIKEGELKLWIKRAIPAVLALDILTVHEVMAPYAASAGAYWYTVTVHFGLAAVVLYIISVALRRFDKILAVSAFWISHLMIPSAVVFLAGDYWDFPPLFAIPMLIYLHSLRRTIADKGRKGQLMGFLYAAYTAGALTVYSSAAAVFSSQNMYYYVIPLCSAALAAIWFFMKEDWKSWTAWYLMPLSIAGGFFLAAKPEFIAADFALLLLYIALILYVMHKSGFRNLAALALLLLFPGTENLYQAVLQGSDVKLLIVLLALFAALRTAGQLIYKKVLFGFQPEGNKLKSALIDWYSIGSLFATGAIISDVSGMQDPGWLRLVGPVCLSLLLFSQRDRVGAAERVRIADTVWIISLLLPYETLMDLLNPPLIISSEARLLPLVPITVYLTRKVWKGFENVNYKVEMAVLLFICAVLFRDILIYDYLADALIMGVLSIGLLFAGMQYHKKHYFAIGSGALVLNGIIQTREFWESLPWWTYLLIAGLILIGIASYNEIKKKKKDSD